MKPYFRAADYAKIRKLAWLSGNKIEAEEFSKMVWQQAKLFKQQYPNAKLQGKGCKSTINNDIAFVNLLNKYPRFKYLTCGILDGGRSMNPTRFVHFPYDKLRSMLDSQRSAAKALANYFRIAEKRI